LARRSLKPQLNQIRTWVRQGRTDAWIAHQLDVSVGDIRTFKREHELAPAEAAGNGDALAPGVEVDEPDLRAEDDALVAEALEAERQAEEAEDEESADTEDDGDDGDGDDDGDGGDRPRSRGRRRGRRGGRGRGGRGRKAQALEGTFDHGEEGYGLWLDPAVQDDPTYAEHWAGHRPVTVTIEADRIVISRAGEDAGDGGDDEDA
jgi:hypothetical protein